MPEEEIIDSLDMIIESAHLIQERFLKITGPDDFVRTPEGVTTSRRIAMRLQVIGESVKQIQKINPSFRQVRIDRWPACLEFPCHSSVLPPKLRMNL